MQIENKQNHNQIQNANQNEENQTEHKTLNHNSLYYIFMQRYFVTYENQTQYLHLHSNGICLISLKRQIFTSKPAKITDFMEISEVKGKKKKGGIKVFPQHIIAKVICQNGTEINVFALIQGTVLQKNQHLTINMIGKSEGYFVVILPSRKIVPDKLGLKKIMIDHFGQ